VIEYVEHLHEHFTDPVDIVNVTYRPTGRPGYSVQMKPESVQRYSYPAGSYWISQLEGVAVGI
jgi:L-fuconate dehydratase